MLAAACGAGCKKDPAPAGGGGDQHGAAGLWPAGHIAWTFPRRCGRSRGSVCEGRDAECREDAASGQYELLPDASGGSIGWRWRGVWSCWFAQYQRVEKGQRLYRLDAAGWREMQEQIASWRERAGAGEGEAGVDDTDPCGAPEA